MVKRVVILARQKPQGAKVMLVTAALLSLSAMSLPNENLPFGSAVPEAALAEMRGGQSPAPAGFTPRQMRYFLEQQASADFQRTNTTLPVQFDNWFANEGIALIAANIAMMPG